MSSVSRYSNHRNGFFPVIECLSVVVRSFVFIRYCFMIIRPLSSVSLHLVYFIYPLMQVKIIMFALKRFYFELYQLFISTSFSRVGFFSIRLLSIIPNFRHPRFFLTSLFLDEVWSIVCYLVVRRHLLLTNI